MALNANNSAGILNLQDASYFDIDNLSQTAKSGGHCIIRAKSNIAAIIVKAATITDAEL